MSFPTRILLSFSIAALALSGAAHAALVPPPGYAAAVNHKGGSSFECPRTPAPFTGTLDFPSKYEGSGKARDTVNENADARYKALTKPITDMEKGVVRSVDKYMGSGNPAALQCAMDKYTAWADAGALLGPAANHTGRSLRKWSLASLSSAYLRLEYSSSKPLASYAQATPKIEAWLGKVADQVVTEWPENDPINKINNHYYWAAWGVMATSVVTDRRDLFDWSVKMYRIFAQQVDRDGYLPNELARESRALGYNNYAITPIAMMAAFGKANGVDLAAEGDHALKRAAEQTLKGIDDPRIFESKAGYKQVLEGFDEQSSKLAWLEPYCWTVGCSGPEAQKAASIRPMKNTRLGGNVTTSFGAH